MVFNTTFNNISVILWQLEGDTECFFCKYKLIYYILLKMYKNTCTIYYKNTCTIYYKNTCTIYYEKLTWILL